MPISVTDGQGESREPDWRVRVVNAVSDGGRKDGQSSLAAAHVTAEGLRRRRRTGPYLRSRSITAATRPCLQSVPGSLAAAASISRRV